MTILPLMPALLVVAAIACYMGYKLISRLLRARAHANACYRLASQAYKMISTINSPLGGVGDLTARQRSSDDITSALADKDINRLKAYANLIGKQPSISIALAAYMVAYMNLKEDNPSLTPETLTSEQVFAYNEIVSVTGGVNITDRSILDNNSSRVGYYAMEHMDEYPLILSIITDRGINDLDAIKEVMSEMESSGSNVLATGAL